MTILHFTLATIRAYSFHFNIIYMCLYQRVFLFQNINTISCCIILYRILLYNTSTFYFNKNPWFTLYFNI